MLHAMNPHSYFMVVAISPVDGCVYVELDGQLWFMPRPYTMKSSYKASEKRFTLSLLQGGYCAWAERIAPNWAQLTARLKIIFMRLRRGSSNPSRQEIALLGKRLVCQGYLARVECEFLPRGELHAAQAILTDLLFNAVVQDDAFMASDAEGLLSVTHRMLRHQWLVDYTTLMQSKEPGSPRVQLFLAEREHDTMFLQLARVATELRLGRLKRLDKK